VPREKSACRWANFTTPQALSWITVIVRRPSRRAVSGSATLKPERAVAGDRHDTAAGWVGGRALA
jgi:hypothetical protein